MSASSTPVAKFFPFLFIYNCHAEDWVRTPKDQLHPSGTLLASHDIVYVSPAVKAQWDLK